jgi:hypothetical protein
MAGAMDELGDETTWRLRVEARLTALQVLVSVLAIAIGDRAAIADGLERAEEAVRSTASSELDEFLVDAFAEIRMGLIDGPDA